MGERRGMRKEKTGCRKMKRVEGGSGEGMGRRVEMEDVEI